MYWYRIRGHVAEFFVRRKSMTGKEVWSSDWGKVALWPDVKSMERVNEGIVGEDLGDLGKFYVIVDDRERYFSGAWGTGKRRGIMRLLGKRGRRTEPVMSKEATSAMIFMDVVAAEETLRQIQSMGGYKVRVRPIFLDMKNTLGEQRFILVAEKRGGRLGYVRKWEETENGLDVCGKSEGAMRVGFREGLAMVERLRIKERGWKFSMLHEIEDGVRSVDLVDYLKRTRPQMGIALSFRL